jgi:DNA (cytosine-5)-methyltransferase 1
MKQYKLLSLFCGAGGACKGYEDAGFEVWGVDSNPKLRKQYIHPGRFICADAIEILKSKEFIAQFDVIHASPPCQAFSKATAKRHRENHPDLIESVRKELIATGKPFVIENVEGAPLKNYVVLCGTMFGLDVVRHRLFECNPNISFPPFMCNHHKKTIKQNHKGKVDLTKNFHCVVGKPADLESAKKAMGIDWMSVRVISQAIPPAYTNWIGEKLIDHLNETYIP